MLKIDSLQTASTDIAQRYSLDSNSLFDLFKSLSIYTSKANALIKECRKYILDTKGFDYVEASELLVELACALGITSLESDNLPLFMFKNSEDQVIHASNLKRHLIQSEPASRSLLHRVEMQLSNLMMEYHERHNPQSLESLALTKVMAELGVSSAALIFGQYHARLDSKTSEYPLDITRDPELAVYYLTLAGNYFSSAQQDKSHPMNQKDSATNSKMLGHIYSQLGASHYAIASSQGKESSKRHYEESFNALLQALAYGSEEAIEPIILVMFDDKSPVPAKGDLIVNLIEKGNDRNVPYCQTMYNLSMRIKNEMLDRLDGTEESDQFFSDIWFDSISIAIAETYWERFVALGVLLGSTMCNEDHAYYNPEVALELAIQANKIGSSHTPIVSSVCNSLVTHEYYHHEAILMIRDMADNEDIPSMLNWGIHLYENSQYDESLKYLVPSCNKLRRTKAIDSHSLSRMYYYIANAMIKSDRDQPRDKINFYLKHSLNGGLLISGVSLATHYLDNQDYLRGVKAFKRTEAIEKKQQKTGYHPNDDIEVIRKEMRELERKIMGSSKGREALAAYLKHMRQKIRPSDKKALDESTARGNNTLH